MTPIDYNDNFYNVHFQDSIDSAKEIVPLFLTYFKPKTVLDVGCGLGTWLKIFEENQCDVLGIDGDYIEIKKLLIDNNKFKAYNLNEVFNLDRKFDLAISLEVAEHILPENAKTFIDSICFHSDIVLFSAAIPGQEGTLHFNEQYNEYWIDLFAKNGYECIDFLRHKIWNNKKISWWYRQNILIFIKSSEINSTQYDLIKSQKNGNHSTYIHPSLLEHKCRKIDKLEKILNNPIEIFKYYMRQKKTL